MHDCPSCSRPTVRRIAGDWCSFCRGWLIEDDVFAGGEKKSEPKLDTRSTRACTGLCPVVLLESTTQSGRRK
jgi:hypothetical protein